MTGPAAQPIQYRLSQMQCAVLASGNERALTGLRRKLRDVFIGGTRAVILRGLDPAMLGESAFADCLLRIGGWLGRPSVQSPDGERVARVEHRLHDRQVRGTHSDSELRAHSDLHDILALAAVRPARRGGDSFLISAGALHARMERDTPHHLPALYEGYYFGSNPILRSRQRVSTTRVPVFVRRGDEVQCCCNRYFLNMAAAERGEMLPSALIEALDALHATAADMAVQDSFRLNAGDISLWHNWSWLHGRTAFADDAGEARLLLRLWLRSDLAAPLDIRFAQRGEAMDRDHELTMRQGMLTV